MFETGTKECNFNLSDNNGTTDLVIRESTWEDLDVFGKWEAQTEVSQYFSISDNQETVICKFIEDRGNPSMRQYTIVLKETSQPIGRVIIGDLIEGWKAEIFRIYIGELSFRGKGYGKQTMEALLAQCFKVWNLERVYLDHYTGNPASQLYLSLGFQYEGVLRKNCRKNGMLYDVHLMSILKEEYVIGGNSN